MTDTSPSSEPVGETVRERLARLGIVLTEASADPDAIVARLLDRIDEITRAQKDVIVQGYAQLGEMEDRLAEELERYRGLSESFDTRVKSSIEMITGQQQRLFEIRRRQALERLAAGIAHEINNPVAFIRSNLASMREYLDDLRERLPLTEDTRALLDELEQMGEESLTGLERIARITRQLYAAIGGGFWAGNYDSLAGLLESIAALTRTASGSGAHLTLECASAAPMPQHPEAFAEIARSLIENAFDATQDGGAVHIAVTTRDAQLELRVVDTGRGMTREIAERVFDPFFSTKDVGQGVGLGLFTTRALIEANGGEICLESVPGQGTTVVVTLPHGVVAP